MVLNFAQLKGTTICACTIEKYNQILFNIAFLLQFIMNYRIFVKFVIQFLLNEDIAKKFASLNMFIDK